MELRLDGIDTFSAIKGHVHKQISAHQRHKQDNDIWIWVNLCQFI